MINERRAEWAGTALNAFAAETGQDKSGDLQFDRAVVISDLICDLGHLCDQHGIEFSEVIDNAVGNYHEELAIGDDE